jgi:hypothetical protein
MSSELILARGPSNSGRSRRSGATAPGGPALNPEDARLLDNAAKGLLVG